MANSVEKFRSMQKIIGGCHDGYCVIEKPKGMHTNGGCSCLEDLNFQGRQKVGHMLRAAQEMVDDISSLEEENQRLRKSLELYEKEG